MNEGEPKNNSSCGCEQSNKLSETFHHFNALIWQVPTIGIAVASAVFFAAHELRGTASEKITNPWVLDAQLLQFFVLIFGGFILFVLSLTLYRYRHFQTWSAPSNAPSPPFRLRPKANQLLQFIVCELTGILMGLGCMQLFREANLLWAGMVSGVFFWSIVEYKSKEKEQELIMNRGLAVSSNETIKSNNVNVSNWLIVLLTFWLAFVAQQQFRIDEAQQKIASELAEITQAQERAKMRVAKKELRDIAQKAVVMFPRGIKTYFSSNIDSNLEIIKKFHELLNIGYSNYYLAQNEKCADRWMRAIGILDEFFVVANVWGHLPDEETRKVVGESMSKRVEEAWGEVVKVYLELGLNFIQEPEASVGTSQN